VFHVKQPDEFPVTAPPVPDAAQGVFGVSVGTATAYAELLATDGIVRGLIGPREVPRLWDRHLLNCAVVTDLVAEGSTVCDVGSGAGLPGLVMAVRRPDLQVTLVEPLLRRTIFLEEAVSALGLANVVVVRGRAEEVVGSSYDVVTSRAVAPLDRLTKWSLPLTRSGGLFLSMKGSSAPTEVTAAASVIRKYGGSFLDIAEVGTGVVDPPVRVVRIKKN
jgi:16S rRNA (guanine527-N7)-methyltransferase